MSLDVCGVKNCGKSLRNGCVVGVMPWVDVCSECYEKIARVRSELGPAIMEFHARALRLAPNETTPEFAAAERRVNELRSFEAWLGEHEKLIDAMRLDGGPG